MIRLPYRFRKVLMMGLMLSLVLSLFPIYPPAVGAEEDRQALAVVNSGFEEVADGKPEGWTVATGPETHIQSVTDVVNSGTHSVKLVDESNTSSTSLRSTPIPITPGENYEATVFSYNLAGTSELYLEFWDENDEYITIQRGINSTLDEWFEVSVRHIAPEDAVYVTLRLYLHGANVGSAYFDDIGFYQIAPEPKAVLKNGGMEQVVNGQPEHWTILSAGAVELSTEQVLSGTHSVKLTDENPSGGISFRSHQIPVDAGVEYEAAVFSYNLEGDSWLYLEYWDDAGNYLDILTVRNMTLNQWERISAAGVAPEGTAYATLRFYLGGTNIGAAYYDEATFDQVIAEPESLLLNGGMERVVSGLPEDWTALAPGTAESSTELAYNGMYSVKLTDSNPDGGVSLRSHQIPVQAGEEYEATAYSYNTEGDSWLYLEFWDAAGNYLDILTGRNATLNQWEHLVVGGEAPEGTVYATVRFYQGKANVGMAYFDDATFDSVVSEQPKYEESLQNGDLELVEGGLPAYWQALNPGTAESSTEQVHSGTYSLKLRDERDDRGISFRSHPIGVTAGEKYEAAVFSYNLEGVSELYVEFWDAAGNYTNIVTGRNDSLDEWNRIIVSGVAPENTVYATLRFYLHVANVGEAYFDDATFGVAPLEPGRNLENGSFERISTGGNPLFWRTESGIAAPSNAHAYHGENSMRLESEDDEPGVLRSHSLPVFPDTDYLANVHVYVEAGKADFELEFWDEDQMLITQAAVNSTTTGAWEELTIREMAPPNAAFASLRISNSLDSAGVIYADSASFQRTGDVMNKKTRVTYYSTEERATAQQNAEELNWAKSMRQEVVRKADAYVDKGLDFLWKSVPAQTLPRSYGVNQVLGSPVTGRAIDAYGNYPYQADPLNEPWKIVDPSSGYVFPTNDFASYYESGLDERGIFQPELADDQYLVNELYPEKGPDWGVDDGFGWVNEKGERYTFVAYYVHWFLWYQSGMIEDAIKNLRDAYLYTGDVKYARAGIVLLDRVADVYPDMDTSLYDRTVFLNSHGGTGKGKIVGSIWETIIIKEFVSAYDAFYPAMDDPQVVQFLQSKSEQLKLTNPKQTAADIRLNIEEGIIKEIFPAIKASQIRGNDGMHQSALAMAAVVYDTMPETKEWLDFTFQSGVSNGSHVTGGNILNSIVTNVDRDGHGNEAAPGYNAIWLRQHLLTADILNGYDGYPEADLFQNAKFRKMFSAMYPLMLSERYTPHIGDTGRTGNPLMMPEMQHAVIAFAQYGDPIFAQLAYFLNNSRTEGIHEDIFTGNPDAIAEQIQAVIDEHGPLHLKSDNLAGYGLAALRDGVNTFHGSLGVLYGFPDLEVEESNTPTRLFEDSGTVQLEANEPGAVITFSFDVAKTDEYDIELLPFKAPTFGIYRILIDGQPVQEMDFFGSRTDNYEYVTTMELEEGRHQITFENIGKHPESGNYKMGVRVLNLIDEEARENLENMDDHVNTLRDFWMYYGRNRGHGHADTLNLGVHAYGLDLAPDLGYPEFADSIDMHRAQWVVNTVSHNTVVVDERKQGQQWVAEPKHFHDGDLVKLIDVEAPLVYPQTELYKRTTAMIKVDDEHSYAVDFFRVKGGDDHHFSFHGAEGTVSTEGLNMVVQPTGTYAGPDVEYGQRVDDVSGSGYMGHGFHYLKNVERDSNPSTQFSVDWDVVDTWNALQQDEDIHLRLTMLGEVDEVALADGVPPQNKAGNPETLRYFIAHRTGTDLDSIFTSVIEPYKAARYIASIEPAVVKLDGEVVSEEGSDVRAVKVTLTNGRVDYIVSAMNPDVLYTVDDTFTFQGFFGVYAEKDGEPVHVYLNDGTKIADILQLETNALTGTVQDFTKELVVDNQITVELDQAGLSDLDETLEGLIGSYLYIETDDANYGSYAIRNGAYPIEGIKERNGNQVTFDIGELTFIRGYVNPSQLEDGFVYNIAEGAAVTIPLAAELKIVTVPMMLDTLEQLQEAFTTEEAYRALNLHLTSLVRFEQLGEVGKLRQHMEGFHFLLKHRQEQGMVTEEAYRVLKAEADALLASLQ